MPYATRVCGLNVLVYTEGRDVTHGAYGQCFPVLVCRSTDVVEEEHFQRRGRMFMHIYVYIDRYTYLFMYCGLKLLVYSALLVSAYTLSCGLELLVYAALLVYAYTSYAAQGSHIYVLRS